MKIINPDKRLRLVHWTDSATASWPARYLSKASSGESSWFKGPPAAFKPAQHALPFQPRFGLAQSILAILKTGSRLAFALLHW